MNKALTALAVYNVGKLIVIEEVFPLSCSTTELGEFIEGAGTMAVGWIAFHWGKTIREYQGSKRDIAASMALKWLECFVKGTPTFAG